MPKEDSFNVTVAGKIDLSGVEIDDSAPLRIAAVRDGEILASTALDAGSGIGYQLDIPLPGPCGFKLVLGRADVADRVFLGSELASVPVSSRQPEPRPRDEQAKAGASALTLEATTITIDASRYRIWLGWCQQFRIHGRLVCRNRRWNGRFWTICDEPVPGAKVEIYDVDRFWWFYRRDLVTTVVTAPDGTFEADFTWCCPRWLPIFDEPWQIDPVLLARIKQLVDQERPHFKIPLPDPPDPFQLQPYIEALGSALSVGDATRSARSAAKVQPLSESEIAERLPADDLVARRVWPWFPYRDCRPDVVIRATQECQGTVEVVYEESNLHTRWDIPNDLSVTLVANDKACCIPTCDDPPCGECVKFGEVGGLSVGTIGGNDPAVPVAAELLGLADPGGGDISFARTMTLTGVFGDMAAVDYYEIEYSVDGSTFDPLPPGTVAGFSRVFWGPPCAGGAPTWNGASFPVQAKVDLSSATHHVIESREHFQENCTLGSWDNVYYPGGGRFWTSNRDGLFEWVTSALLLPDGLYTLRVVAWTEDGPDGIKEPRVLKRCDTEEEEHLLIRLDNRIVPNHPPSVPDHPWGPGFVHAGTVDPDCDFTTIIKNEGTPSQLTVSPCDIIELADTDSLTVHYMVTVPAADSDRHLGGYWMQVHHAESAVFDALAAAGGPLPDPTPEVGPTYADALAQRAALGQPAGRPWWGGGNYKITLPGTAFPETCAYLFALHAYKRVFSGCEDIKWFHDNDTEMSITIKKV